MVHRSTVALLSLGLCAGCATIVSGTTQRLRFESEPSGATVEVEGQTAVTPATLAVARRAPSQGMMRAPGEEALTPLSVKFSKPGYDPLEMSIPRGRNGWIWANLAFGALPMFVDGYTGADIAISQDLIEATLKPKPEEAEER